MLHCLTLPLLLRLTVLTIGLAAISHASLVAQTVAPKYADAGARPVAGRIIVKLTADAASRRVDVRSLSQNHPQLLIERASAWINPALTTFNVPRNDSPIGVDESIGGLERISVVEYGSGVTPQDAATLIARSTDVEYAEPMYARHLHYAPNDPETPKLWYLDVVGARDAWDVVRADSSIVIAIVDAGIDASHEDLAAAIWHNSGEMGIAAGGADRKSNGIDDDGNGYIDDWQGYDFAGRDGRTPDNNPDPARESHGTEMAGIAGAIGDNGRGTVGIAFGARLMSLKITDEPASFGSPDLYNGHEAILYAAKMGADVINCSWGDLGRMRSEQEVIAAATQQYGAVVVASAGNASDDNIYFPSGYEGVLSVGAVESGDMRASFSNYNYRVDVSAPGTFIYSSALSNQYLYGQGTSHAAAVASGAAALVRMKYPSLRPSQIVEVLRATADDNSAALGQFAGRLGTGRINLLAAVNEGAATSSARLSSYAVADQSGDGILDPGETVTIVADVQNHLAPSASVIATLSAVSPVFSVENPTADLGAMDADAVETTPPGVFQFTVPAGALPNSPITLKLAVQTPSRTNESYIELVVAPTYMTTDLNRIAATFNSEGNVGYNGTNRRQGDGFRMNGGKDLIYHGGLMIGTSAAKLSDVVRTGPVYQGTALGFEMTTPYRLTLASDGSVEIGRARFDDSHRDASVRVGVDVTMQTYEYNDPSDRDYVLVVYDVLNTGASTLDNLHLGQYLDWDISAIGIGDVASLDEQRRLGFVTNEQHPGVAVGAAALGDIPLAFSAVDNLDLDITSEFSSERKWQLLGNGIGLRTTEPTDAGLIIGVGPFSLGTGRSRKIAMVLTAATTVDELREAVERASERFSVLSAVAGDRQRTSMRVSPNPTTGDAVFTFDAIRGSDIGIRIFDATGREVAGAHRAGASAGMQSITMDLSTVSSGIYAFEIIVNGSVERGTIVKL